MIGDKERGSSWTNAFLGIQAKRIHVCGDERALHLINKLCNLTGDTVIFIK
jgi:ATP-dependent RNA helicase SUPV3L1/SUV3